MPSYLPNPRSVLTGVLTLVVMATCGCGWQYAGEVEQRHTVRPSSAPAAQKAPPPAAVPAALQATPQRAHVVAGARDLFTLGENHRASVHATIDRMADHAFEVRLVDGMNDARQLVHCSSGKVVRFEKRRAAPDALAGLKAAGMPPGVWILEVDPSAVRGDLPNNDWYRHIAKYHRLEYVDRHRQRGTVLYRYLGARRTLSLR